MLTKDASNLIGISIGGGSPFCPCLYIVQVFDNSPAAKEGSLEAGDELMSVNKQSVKSKTKTAVAKLIQSAEVFIDYICVTICNDYRATFIYNTTNCTPIRNREIRWILY